MKVINIEKQPTFSVDLTAREAQVIEQALYRSQSSGTSFGDECMLLHDQFYDLIDENGVEPLAGGTE